MVGYHGAARLEPRANLMCDVRDAAALFGARDYRYLENPLDRQAEQASLLFEIVGVVDVVVQYRRKKRRPFISRGEGRLPKSRRYIRDMLGSGLMALPPWSRWLLFCVCQRWS